MYKTSLLYKYTQLTVQVFTKPVYCTMERNVHGQNITKVGLYELCAKCVQTVTLQVYTKPVNCTSVYKTVCKLVGISLNKLKVDN